MAFVFYANSGTLHTFDVELALESVSKLKEEINDKINVSIGNQVLLINGGQLLNAANKICFYNGCGTVESNPIYLFNKSIMEMPSPPSVKPYTSNIRWAELVESALNLPNSIKTVAVRTDLALQLSKEDDRIVEELKILVRDQQLQYAAWKAVFANLGSVADSLRKRLNTFNSNCNDYISKREKYSTTLDRLDHVLSLLKYIPVIQRLLPNGDNEVESTEMSLFDWIITQDAGSNLNNMIEDCSRALRHLNDDFYKELVREMFTVADAVNNVDMIEVKGIENRFNDLSALVAGGEEIAQNQTEMAQGFVQNNDRVSNLNDSSILSDLWQGHTEQLRLMHVKHKKLIDIYQRCFRSKAELSHNLHGRLRWLILMERSICECDSKLVIHHQTLKHLRHRLSILEQIRSSPEVYLKLLSETVHRWEFSVNVMHWASKVYEKSQKELQEEINRRKQFADWIGKHFLLRLFPGLSEYPVTYSHQPPKTINTSLPSISRDDLQRLYHELNDDALSEGSLKDLAQDLLMKPCNFNCSGKLSPTSKSNRFEFVAMEDTIVPANNAYSNSPRLFSDEPGYSEPFVFTNKADNINKDSLKIGENGEDSPRNNNSDANTPNSENQIEKRGDDSVTKANEMFQKWKNSYIATVKSELNVILNEVKKNQLDIDEYVTKTKDNINVALESFLEQQSSIVTNTSDSHVEDRRNVNDNPSSQDTINLTALQQAVEDCLRNDIARKDSSADSFVSSIDVNIENIVQIINASKKQKDELDEIKKELATIKASREPLAIIEMQERLLAKDDECNSLKQQISSLSASQAVDILNDNPSSKSKIPDAFTQIFKSISITSAALSEYKQVCTSVTNDGNIDARVSTLSVSIDKVESQVTLLNQELQEVMREFQKPNENDMVRQDSNDKVSSLSEIDALKAENEYLKEKLNEKSTSSSVAANSPFAKTVAYNDFKIKDYIIVVFNNVTQMYEICSPYQNFYIIHPLCQTIFKNHDTGVGNKGSHWIFAQIEKMEYCKAKKENNRFNIPKDKTFFLIFAKPSNFIQR